MYEKIKKGGKVCCNYRFLFYIEKQAYSLKVFKYDEKTKVFLDKLCQKLTRRGRKVYPMNRV